MVTRIGVIGILLAVLALSAGRPVAAQRLRSVNRAGLFSPPVRRAATRQLGTALRHAPVKPAVAKSRPTSQTTGSAPVPTPEMVTPVTADSVGTLHAASCPSCATGGYATGSFAPGQFGPSLPGFFGPYDRRYVGPGEPLLSGSWLNRPYSFGVLFGLIAGDEVLPGNVDQGTDLIGGYRLGWDLNHFWGIETRLAFAALDLDNEIGNNDLGTGDALFWDVDALYYPWGDSRWRPYFSMGLGLANFKFTDPAGKLHRQDRLGLPIGIGIKHRFRPWFVLRADLTDNIGLGSGTLHNVSFIFSTEIRFGGERVSYWPWMPT